MLGAVFLGRDGEGRRLGDEVDDFDSLRRRARSRGRARVGADTASDDDRRLLGEGFDAVEDLGRHGSFGHDALNGAGAVAEGGEEQLAGRADVVEPAAAECDALALVGGKGCGARKRMASVRA